MPPLLGQFPGELLDQSVDVGVYTSHLVFSMEMDGDRIEVEVEMDEVDDVRIENAEGFAVLTIVDPWGTTVVSLKMDRAQARRAKALIERARRTNG